MQLFSSAMRHNELLPTFSAPSRLRYLKFKQGSESLRAVPGLSRRGSNRNLSHSTHILSPVADCTIGPLDQTGQNQTQSAERARQLARRLRPRHDLRALGQDLAGPSTNPQLSEVGGHRGGVLAALRFSQLSRIYLTTQATRARARKGLSTQTEIDTARLERSDGNARRRLNS